MTGGAAGVAPVASSAVVFALAASLGRGPGAGPTAAPGSGASVAFAAGSGASAAFAAGPVARAVFAAGVSFGAVVGLASFAGAVSAAICSCAARTSSARASRRVASSVREVDWRFRTSRGAVWRLKKKT